LNKSEQFVYSFDPVIRKLPHFEIICNFSPKETLLFCKKATDNAIKKATMAGIA
jgi:hypothetical protein